MEEYGLAVWVRLDGNFVSKLSSFLFQALSLVIVVTWQVAGWEGISPNPLGHILERSKIGFLRVVVMLVASL